MDNAKRILAVFLVGAAVGVIAAVLIAPGIIEWWSTPAVPSPIDCSTPIQWALARMRRSIGIAALAVGVLAVIAGEILRHLRKKRGSTAAAG